MEEEKEKIETTEKLYVGLFKKKDGWYKMYSDGKNHFTYEKYVDED